MAWQTAPFRASEIADNAVVGVHIDGIPVALYKLDGKVFATHGICTHALALLSDGWVEDGKIECPLHQGLFDIRTGKALCEPVTKNLKIYPVKVEADQIFIDVKQGAVAETEAHVPGEATQPGAKTEPHPQSVVIIGGGQAAAAAIRAMRSSAFRGKITVIAEEEHLPYERPPLSKDFIVLPGAEIAYLMKRGDAVEAAVEFRHKVRATKIEAQERIVALSDGSTLSYDSLLLAVGGHARRLTVPGADLPGVHTLRTVEDARAIAASLARSKHVAVIGGGFIGLELASSATARGVKVTLLERDRELMTRLLPPTVGALFRGLAENAGVEVRCGASIREIRKIGECLQLFNQDGPEVFDAVLVGVGMEPSTQLAMTAGCAIDRGIVVDEEGKTSVAGIWAAGDCAAHHVASDGTRILLESWQNAEEQGAAAGRSIAGTPRPSDKQPWFWSDQFGENIQIVGIPHRSHVVAFKGGNPELPARGDVCYFVEPFARTIRAVLAISSPAAIREGRSLLGKPFASLSSEQLVILDAEETQEGEEDSMNRPAMASDFRTYAWPAEGLSRIPDWVYTDRKIYDREVEKIFHGKTWNFVALECEVPNTGDFIRSNVGPTPVVVSRAADGSVHVFENRCSHRAAEFCRDLSGNVSEFVCPYHQWSYDLKGNLAGVPFRRGAGGKGGMPADFKTSDHGPTRLRVATHRGVVFASYSNEVEPLEQYLGEEVLREFNATFDGRKLKLLGYYRHTLPGNWKLYHENLRDPYHATLLHTFLVTFGLLVAGNKFMMLMDPTGRHGVMGSAKSDVKNVAGDDKKEMRAFRENMTLAEPRFMDFIPEFDSPWSVTMSTIWPNLIVQREMNTLGIRHIIPTGPNEFIMKWTMFGFEGDDEEMTRHRLRQGNLMGPAGFLGIEDNEAIKFVQDGMLNVREKEHLVMLDPEVPAGSTDNIISEAAIRAMYKHWRAEMGV